MENKHTCLHCSKTILRGRNDKKYCNDYCRTEYNNKKLRDKKGKLSIKKINSILQLNREILCGFIDKKGTISVDVNTLLGYGFHFNFHTHTVSVKKTVKTYCYDVGYIRKNERELLIFKIETGE